MAAKVMGNRVAICCQSEDISVLGLFNGTTGNPGVLTTPMAISTPCQTDNSMVLLRKHSAATTIAINGAIARSVIAMVSHRAGEGRIDLSSGAGCFGDSSIKFSSPSLGSLGSLARFEAKSDGLVLDWKAMSSLFG
jgi:hypothetical protein